MKAALVALLALAGCAVQSPEPPRVERVTVSPEARIPCERTAPGLPDWRTATALDVAQFLPVLAGRLERCADRYDALVRTVAPE